MSRDTEQSPESTTAKSQNGNNKRSVFKALLIGFGCGVFFIVAAKLVSNVV